jgi:hypothetical protein
MSKNFGMTIDNLTVSVNVVTADGETIHCDESNAATSQKVRISFGQFVEVSG